VVLICFFIGIGWSSSNRLQDVMTLSGIDALLAADGLCHMSHHACIDDEHHHAWVGP